MKMINKRSFEDEKDFDSQNMFRDSQSYRGGIHGGSQTSYMMKGFGGYQSEGVHKMIKPFKSIKHELMGPRKPPDIDRVKAAEMMRR